MKLFNVRENNTEETLKLAIEKARELNTDLVVATTTGATGLKAVEMTKQYDFANRLILVTHAYGSRIKGANIMPEEVRQQLKKDAIVVTAGHALSMGERGLSGQFKGIFPLELIATVLRQFSAGTKVCYEIALMGCDAGEIEYLKPVVCVGGTGKGADTACVITPSYSSSLLDQKINEIICKPDLYPQKED